MFGADGYIDRKQINITWEQFASWQRWDEYPENANDPPMTVDMTFHFQGNTYYLDCINHEYAILTDQWQPIIANANLLTLLHLPVKQWGGHSFRELIGEMLFED